MVRMRIRKAIFMMIVLFSPIAFSVPFGFFASSMNGVGKGEYSSEVKGMSNFVHVRGVDLNEVISKIEMAKKNNLKAMIHVQNIYFPWHSSRLALNWKVAADEFLGNLKKYENDIVGFYLFDEPYWVNSMAGWESLPEQELKVNLETSTAHLKAIFAQTPVVLTFAYPEVNSNLMIPSNVDFLGINCYFSYGSKCSEKEVKRLHDLLRSKMSLHQKFVYTVDAYYNQLPNEMVEAQIVQRIQFLDKIIELDFKQNRLGMLLPFLFQTHRAEGLFGVEDMPMVKIEIQKMFFKYSK